MKKVALICFLLVSIVVSAFAATQPWRKLTYDERIVILEQKIIGLEQRIQRIEVFISPGIKLSDGELADIKNPSSHNVDFKDSFVVGSIGYLSSVKVLHIFDANNFLGQFEQTFYVSTGSVGESRFLTFAPTRPVSYPKKVWIKGLPTKNLVDNMRIDTNCLFKVTGTKSFEDNYDGKITVFLIEPVR
jgi:hypothetical protein